MRTWIFSLSAVLLMQSGLLLAEDGRPVPSHAGKPQPVATAKAGQTVQPEIGQPDRKNPLLNVPGLCSLPQGSEGIDLTKLPGISLR